MKQWLALTFIDGHGKWDNNGNCLCWNLKGILAPDGVKLILGINTFSPTIFPDKILAFITRFPSLWLSASSHYTILMIDLCFLITLPVHLPLMWLSDLEFLEHLILFRNFGVFTCSNAVKEWSDIQYLCIIGASS